MGAISFSIDEQFLAEITRLTPARVFVETGTFKGESLEIAQRYFPEYWSVELSAHYFEAAKTAFSGRHKVHLFNEPSPALLQREQTRFADCPVVFWLDAHWCVAESTAGGDSQSPLLEELQAIRTLHSQSVLLIDDARLYLCAPPAPHQLAHWPDFHSILEKLFRLSSIHRLMILNDVIVFYPGALHEAFSRYAHVHGVDWLALANEARTYGKKRLRRKKLQRQVLDIPKALFSPFKSIGPRVKSD